MFSCQPFVDSVPSCKLLFYLENVRNLLSVSFASLNLCKCYIVPLDLLAKIDVYIDAGLLARLRLCLFSFSMNTE